MKAKGDRGIGGKDQGGIRIGTSCYTEGDSEVVPYNRPTLTPPNNDSGGSSTQAPKRKALLIKRKATLPPK